MTYPSCEAGSEVKVLVVSDAPRVGRSVAGLFSELVALSVLGILWLSAARPHLRLSLGWLSFLSLCDLSPLYKDAVFWIQGLSYRTLSQDPYLLYLLILSFQMRSLRGMGHEDLDMYFWGLDSAAIHRTRIGLISYPSSAKLDVRK
jgi:hypothetical protein